MSYTDIDRSSDYFETSLYTGTGSSLSISSLDFSPDLTWIKGRSGATEHVLTDSVRGVTKELNENIRNTDTQFDLTREKANLQERFIEDVIDNKSSIIEESKSKISANEKSIKTKKQWKKEIFRYKRRISFRSSKNFYTLIMISFFENLCPMQ